MGFGSVSRFYRRESKRHLPHFYDVQCSLPRRVAPYESGFVCASARRISSHPNLNSVTVESGDRTLSASPPPMPAHPYLHCWAAILSRSFPLMASVPGCSTNLACYLFPFWPSQLLPFLSPPAPGPNALFPAVHCRRSESATVIRFSVATRSRGIPPGCLGDRAIRVPERLRQLLPLRSRCASLSCYRYRNRADVMEGLGASIEGRLASLGAGRCLPAPMNGR